MNPATYRQQITNAFGRDIPHITQELCVVLQTGQQLEQQGDLLGAATIHETLVTEIFAQSRLYYEEVAYDDYYEEERYYPEEDDLSRNTLKYWGTR